MESTPNRGEKRELARKLASAGKSLDAIASALGVSRACARTHVNALKRQGKLPQNLPGLGLAKIVSIKDAPNPPPRKPTRQPERPREEQVFDLAKQGKKAKEIAEALDISQQTVYVHLASLRRQGRLPQLTRESVLPPAPKEAPRAPQAATEVNSAPFQPPPGTPPDAQPQTQSSATALVSARREALQAEAVRQCRANNTPAGPALFMTTLGGDRKHAHRAKVDRLGDGVTEPDETRHQHRVHRFVAQTLDHGHALMLP